MPDGLYTSDQVTARVRTLVIRHVVQVMPWMCDLCNGVCSFYKYVGIYSVLDTSLSVVE